MIKLVSNVSLALLLMVGSVFAATQTADQKTVVAFVQKMYSYSANMFEGGIFDGKDNPQKQCLLLRGFFLPNLLTPEDKKWHGCEIAVKVFLRYPGIPSEDFDIYGAPGAIKKPKFSQLTVEGAKASIAATTEFGTTVFFLTMTDKGWRIENALYDEWPIIQDGKCRSDFLVPPSALQKRRAPAICQ
jgi:hypothetical protein